MKKLKVCIAAILLLFPLLLSAQEESSAAGRLDVGLNFKKYGGFYWVNGVAAEFSSKKILKEKLSFGLSIQSSLLGSAIASNAISTFETELAAIKYFRRSKSLQPFIRLNSGFAVNDYGDAELNQLTRSGFLLAFETGLKYQMPMAEGRYSMGISGGYNIFTGDGITGLGTIYPVYARFLLLYRIKS
jgi:hypothetical protein